MEGFFDRISTYYDDMIDFEGALQRRAAYLEKFIEPGMEYAADAGCGTGLDSIALNRLGLKVRSFDLSPGMIKEAEQNALEAGAKIKFYNYALTDIPSSYNNSFDIAVSLGNTLANIPEDEIDDAILKLFEILKPGGKLILQILNFERLQLNNDRIINVTGKDGIYFVRFYDFLKDYINFNILKFNSANLKERSLETTIIYPYSVDEMTAYLENHKFRNIEVFGSLDKSAFDTRFSSDIVITASR